MAVKHPTAADGTFSASGALAWDEDHEVEDSTITPAMLDRVYTVPADLLPYQVSSAISSAAFRDASFFAESTAIALYQLSSQISSAAFQLSTAWYATSVAVTGIFGFPGGATSFLSGQSTFIRPDVTALSGYSGGSTAYLSGLSTFQVPNVTTLTGFTGNTAHFLRGDSTFAAPSGGSDPWTYLKVSSTHYGTSNVAFSTIPGLSFVPDQNSTYEFEIVLMMKTSTAAVTPRSGIRWPVGVTSASWYNQGQTNSTQVFTYGNNISTMLSPAAGLLATTTAPWIVIMGGVMATFGGTSSSLGVMQATESTTVFVSTLIGSFLKYRTY